jgi:hypothetical protein
LDFTINMETARLPGNLPSAYPETTGNDHTSQIKKSQSEEEATGP